VIVPGVSKNHETVFSPVAGIEESG
jgi:hypothetical protein